MPTDPAEVRWLREAYELATAALVALEDSDDPTLWRGPAARAYGRGLDERRVRVRRALGAVAAAADELAVAPPAPGGG